MKKIIYLFLILVIAVIGWGYLRKSTPEIKSEPPKELGEVLYEKKVGVLKGLNSPITEKKVSHILDLDTGEIIYLTSKFVDLSSEQYLNKKVEVVGPVINDGDKNFMDIETINIIDKTLYGLEDENTWKTYEDTEIGIKIQYKSILYPEKTDEKVTFVSVKEKNEQIAANQNSSYNEIITIQKYENLPKKDLNQWIYNEEKISKQDQHPSMIGLNNLNSVFVETNNQNSVFYYIAREKIIYKISHISTGGTEKDNYRNIFNEMLRSFQYVDIVAPPAMEEANEKNIEDKTNEDKNIDNTDKTKENDTTKDENTIEEKSEGENAEIDKKETKTETSATDDSEKSQSPTTEKTANPNLNENYQKIIAEVEANIMNIAPESPTSGTWFPAKYEFVEPHYVYVEYQSGNEKRKVLLTYEIKTTKVTTSLVGYFKPGADKDWETVTGKNEAAGKSREVITVNSSGEVKKEMDVKEGFRYFESTTYKFKMQYPSNWYYSGASGHYEFSDQPSGTGTELISLYVLPQGIDSFSSEGTTLTLSEKKAFLTKKNGELIIYVEKSDGKTYKISGGSQLSDTIKMMAGTIED